ncbi:hypothetical protein ACP70R_042252 [Stipagrostis hirtigluma subsp. patula]
MARHGGGRLLLLLVTLLAAAAVALVAASPEAPEVAAAAVAQNASEEEHLLPRPLVIELPSSAEEARDEGLEEEVPVDVRCASWRLAAEANNLAPWQAVPAECAAHVRDYVTGAAYRSDLEHVARESSAYARAVALAGDGRDAWVFDVDETLLSNLPYYAEHGYGLELFDHHAFDKWVERGEAPAIPSSLRLYKEVRELGFKTFLLTGRSEGHKGVTMENLKKQGFHDWDKLILSGQQLTARKQQQSTNRKRGRKWKKRGTGS